MNSQTVRMLAVATALLLVVLLLIETNDDDDSSTEGSVFVTGLKEQLNDVNKVTVSSGDESVAIVSADGVWVLPGRGDYPADVAKIREILLAIADAKIIERKTSNPESYDQLGVGDEGTMVSLGGDGFTYDIIIGNNAQTSYRYARLKDDEQSWLININPEFPEDSGGWLQADVLDIAAARVAGTSIEHPDGQLIQISKASADDTNYEVLNIPEGRELSYPTVANGIAGALSTLRLEDVQKAAQADEAVTTEFETFDGLTITVRSAMIDDSVWISIGAMGEGETAEEAESINSRLAGWLFQIPEYKSNMLRRQWTDILKAEPEAEAEE